MARERAKTAITRKAHNRIDLIGHRFGKLTVISEAPTDYVRGRSMWVAACDCGTTCKAVGKYFRNGQKFSCGCVQRENRANMGHNAIVKHGDSSGGKSTKLYNVWRGMIRRCSERKSKSYKHYGARGIIVCDVWKDNYQAFKTWALSNGYEPSLTIDRKNNDGNYEPSNCRWVTPKVNSNNRRSSVKVEAFGKLKTYAEWADDPLCNVAVFTLRMRIRRWGWPNEEAITTPVLRRASR